MKAAAVFTEQRCWYDASTNTIRGRKRLSALGSLATAAPLSVVFRPGRVGDGVEPLLDRASGHVVVDWDDEKPLLLRALSAFASVGRVVARHRATVVYLPGVLGSLAGLWALVLRRRIVAIAVGNPQESLAPEVVPGRLGGVTRTVMTSSMRMVCRRATVVRYVTRWSLQRDFPPGKQTRAFAASDVGTLPLHAVRDRPDGTVRLLTVASLDQPYKGIRELLDAIACLLVAGVDVHLEIAGTGRLEESLRAHARAVAPGRVTFAGHLDEVGLADAYDRADAFVLASWTEGLPRVVVEAMAASLPVAATSVGGIRELIEPHWLCPPRDVDELAATLRELLALDGPAWRAVSSRNRSVASSFLMRSAQGDADFARAAAEVIA